jgi:chemotaxis signal transduction protein
MTKRKTNMDKVLGENDIKGLEEEIDSAVDRLFVEKQGTPLETLSKPPPSPTPPPLKEQPFQIEKDFDFETPLPTPPPTPTPTPTASTPSPVSKSIEKMEGQLLSLEWEISKENLGKTREEVLALRQTTREEPEVTSVLNLMEKVLDYMVRHDDKIRPPFVKFLMDCKETLKLLMRKEADGELNIYQQLAYVGIQARYSSLEELKEAKPERPVQSLREEIERAGIIIQMESQLGEISQKMNLFLEKMEHLTQKMELFLSKRGEALSQPREPLPAIRHVPISVTVFKVEERLFGVESDKVYKLFKVPSDHQDKYSDQQKIRLRDFEVRVIDLRKILSIPKGDRKGEMRILALSDNEEYKGLMIDQVLEKLSTQMDTGGNYGEYVAGIIRSTYRERPVEIPVLDLKKF